MSNRDYEADYNWQLRYLPEIKPILGTHLINQAPVEEDQQRNTDLMVLKLASVRVACRIRHHGYLHQKDYRNQFTIRTDRRSGIKTELAKVLEGWGDFIFYGFANHDDTQLAAWTLGDLQVFRTWRHGEFDAGRQPWHPHGNPDGTSFNAYSIEDLPPWFVVGRTQFDPQQAPCHATCHSVTPTVRHAAPDPTRPESSTYVHTPTHHWSLIDSSTSETEIVK